MKITIYGWSTRHDICPRNRALFTSDRRCQRETLSSRLGKRSPGVLIGQILRRTLGGLSIRADLTDGRVEPYQWLR